MALIANLVAGLRLFKRYTILAGDNIHQIKVCPLIIRALNESNEHQIMDQPNEDLAHLRSPYASANARAIVNFHDRHKPGASRGGWCYYHDGAYRETDSPFALMMEPSTDEFERLQNSLTYYKICLENAVEEFNQLRHWLQMQDAPVAEGLEKLKQLQKAVGDCNKNVEKAQAALNETAEGRRRAQYHRAQAERKQRQAEWVAELKNVRI